MKQVSHLDEPGLLNQEVDDSETKRPPHPGSDGHIEGTSSDYGGSLGLRHESEARP